jgi:phosphoesterase RecJ-like protein
MNSSLSQQIIRQIKSSRHILLHLHPAPDGDSIGSVLAFYWFLKSLRKKVTIIKGDSSLPQDFRCLPGFDQIAPLNFFDLDLSRFDLFVSLDSSSLGQISKLAPVIFPPSLNTINIDHHPTNTKFAQFNFVSPDSPATSQILYQLFKQWNVKINKNIAINLFIGLYTDTGFKYSHTSSTTFDIAAKLVKICHNFTDYIFQIENNNRPEQLKYKGLALLSVTTHFTNHVAISAVSSETLAQHHISQHDTEKSEISNLLKSVTGWEIGASLVEVQPSLCYLSLRTRDTQRFDVAKIAVTLGNGGGHSAAAGATINLPLPEAKNYLLKIIHQLHPELGEP